MTTRPGVDVDDRRRMMMLATIWRSWQLAVVLLANMYTGGGGTVPGGWWNGGYDEDGRERVLEYSRNQNQGRNEMKE